MPQTGSKRLDIKGQSNLDIIIVIGQNVDVPILALIDEHLGGNRLGDVVAFVK
jgi:hypothetical protein